MYKPKYAHKLTTDPIVVTLNEDEEYKLIPRKKEDQPNIHVVLDTMLDGFQEKSEWENLIPFAQGLIVAGRSLKPGQKGKIARRAAAAGAQYVLLGLLTRVKKTGYSLSDAKLAEQVLAAFQKQAADADFVGEEVSTALKQLERVTRLMDTPEHCANIKDITQDARKQPSTIGVLLEVAAAKALDASIATEEDAQKVINYAKRLVATWSQGNFAVDENSWRHANDQLQLYVPVWHGMELALKVPELAAEPVARAIAAQKDQLEEILQKAYEVLRPHAQEKARVGSAMYEALVLKK